MKKQSHTQKERALLRKIRALKISDNEKKELIRLALMLINREEK